VKEELASSLGSWKRPSLKATYQKSESLVLVTGNAVDYLWNLHQFRERHNENKRSEEPEPIAV
jgi:hypothetical protein